MIPDYDTARLSELLAHPNLHEISGLAHAARTQRHGAVASFAVVDHLDPAGSHSFCPICGAEPPFPRDSQQVSPRATSIHALPARGGDLLDTWSIAKGLGGSRRTVELGVSSDHEAALDVLPRLAGQGLAVVSDGVWPRLHPSVDADAWESFWRAAADLGLRGNTTLLYGPAYTLSDVLDQIARLAALQREIGVFQSVSPLVHSPQGFGGVQDGLLTHGGLDLRILAATRLGLDSIDHVRVNYDRSDLKMAHLALACGADDLEGHLALTTRSASEDADSKNLSVDEMSRWLREAEFEPMMRDGSYHPADSVPVPPPGR